MDCTSVKIVMASVTLLSAVAAITISGSVLGSRLLNNSARQPEAAGTLQMEFLLAMGLIELFLVLTLLHSAGFLWYCAT